jgi:hypothetical protein
MYPRSVILVQREHKQHLPLWKGDVNMTYQLSLISKREWVLNSIAIRIRPGNLDNKPYIIAVDKVREREFGYN